MWKLIHCVASYMWKLQQGHKLYDEDTRVVIRGKYHGEAEVHDESESSDENANNNAMNKEDGSTSPMSIDSDL